MPFPGRTMTAVLSLLQEAWGRRSPRQSGGDHKTSGEILDGDRYGRIARDGDEVFTEVAPLAREKPVEREPREVTRALAQDGTDQRDGGERKDDLVRRETERAA